MALLGLLVVLAASIAIHWPFLETPLERDEGEFAYAGQLILDGDMPYTSMYAMKLPGTYLAYALIEWVLGPTIWGIHFGALLVNLAATVLVYLIGRQLLYPGTGLMAAAVFALVTASPATHGISGQAEHFVLLPALAGTWMLLIAQQRQSLPWYFLSGCGFGGAVLAKQHGFAFALFALACVALFEPTRWRRAWSRRIAELAALTAGMAGVFVPVVIWLAAKGALSAAIFWTIQYPRSYVSMVPLWVQCRQAIQAVAWQIADLWVFWALSLVGITALFWYPPARSHRAWLLAFLAGSILSVMPGGYFRPHYFLLMAPALALLTAVAVSGLSGLYRAQGGDRVLPVVLGLIVLAWPTLHLVNFLRPLSPSQYCQALHGGCPFPEAVVIGKYLKEHTAPNDRIGILGSEPEILFYAHRQGATGHVYMYPLVEPHPHAVTLQQEVMDEIEAARPKYLVFCAQGNSWVNLKGTDYTRLMRWVQRYLSEHYEVVGMVETHWRDDTTYLWGDAAARYRPLGKLWIGVHKRKDA